MDFRDEVQNKLDEMGLSRYWLVQQVKGKIPASTVYEWLAGKHDLPCRKAEIIRQVLKP